MDNDLKRLMERDSLRTTVLSYLLTLVYAAVSAVTAMAGREMIETIALKLIFSQELQSVQYGGFRRISQITALVLMVGLWLTSFMVVWHRIEREDTLKRRLWIGAVWIASAVVGYLVFGLIQLAVVGYWPMLTGAV